MRQERNPYYDVLEEETQGELNITPLAELVPCLGRAYREWRVRRAANCHDIVWHTCYKAAHSGEPACLILPLVRKSSI